ncbi:MinD/ParA family ATP-binding protein [Nesterenkonia flava]|uniref:MinD/ParA family protein n=1 Tax=Nesterenkonia flava TaxID=469799 RepID=A0ABU1FS27_9MICC|nr:MinD/ParA family protein [Nesterenkonia flava]MDR5710951.1 MinD/ParA family protein [Nesterenkonia flava]
MSTAETTTPGTAPMVAEVITPQQVLINGQSHTVPEGSNPYQLVIEQARALAAAHGEPAVVHGLDRVRHEQSWFSVSADGEIVTLPTPPAPVPAPGSPSTSLPPGEHGRADQRRAGTGPVAEGESSVRESAESGEASGTTAPGPARAAVPPRATEQQQAPGQFSSRSPAGFGAGSPGPPHPAEQHPPALSRAERRRLHEEQSRQHFVTPPRERPQSGFRRFLYDVSWGAINIGPTQKQQRERSIADRISRPLVGSHNTAVLSLKGGIGKTSTTVGVGLTLARYRGDIPCAIDANPDSGDLAERALGERAFHAERPRTITDLLKDIEEVDSLTTLQSYIRQSERLHVLAGEQDPAVSDSLTGQEWRKIHHVFSQYYSVVLTDCGTGVTHAAMEGILETADNLIIAASFAVSGAQRAVQTLHWLNSHGYEHLAQRSVVVITDKDNVSERVNKQAIQDSLRGLCRQLVIVPFDRAVVDGDRIDLDLLKESTREAYMEIAAAVVDGYQ